MGKASAKKRILRWYDPIFLAVLPPLAGWLVKLLLFTCREVEIIGQGHETAARSHSGGKAVYVTWHQRLAYFGRHLKNHSPIHTMISQSRDGEYATRLCHWHGHKSVRGSSTRGGSAALKQLTKIVKEGGGGGILADGPKGPARVLKMGAVVMARDARAPIISITWGADRCWVLNSWDRFLIPKPFSRIVVRYAEPFWIPPEATREELETWRQRVEARLNQEARQCDEYFGTERPWRKVRREGIPETGPVP